MITTRAILSIACKIWGLFHLIWGIGFGLSLIPQVVGQSGELGAWLLGQGSVALGSLVIPLVFIRYSDGLASFLVREHQIVQVSLGGDWPVPLFRLCIRVAGLIALVQGIPALIEHLSRYAFFRQAAPAVPIPAEIWSELLGAVVYLGLGGYLLGGAHRLVRFLESASAQASESATP